ncbi:MAG: urease accessory protein [Chryseobacterium sp.]|nr:MAG: urease accessory protein [Chryseobacterium sp.]
MIKLILTIYAGLEHAFEPDHLVAVNTLVSERDNLKQSLKDGIYWGIGHTTTIFFIGIIMIIFKMNIGEDVFRNFEAFVGLMLIVLGIFRLLKIFYPNIKLTSQHSQHLHRAAFGVGSIHGLAGSGALVIMVITQIKSPVDSFAYLMIFGFGSIIGMFLASYLFSIPYTKSFLKSKKAQQALIIISSFLCVFYGVKVVIENLGNHIF